MYRLITLKDLTSLGDRSFIKREHTGEIWNEIMKDNAMVLLDNDFTYLATNNDIKNFSSWTDVKTLLKTYCSERCVISKEKLKSLQEKDLLERKSEDEINLVWKEICEKLNCPTLELNASNKKDESVEEFKFDATSINSSPENDICVVSADGGEKCASTICEGLKKVGLNCLPFTSTTETLDLGKVEKCIANSVATVVILTKDCLQKREILFSLQAASFHYSNQHSRVILIHAAESCDFPVPPNNKEIKACFEDKAITWLSCYDKEGLEHIEQKYLKEKMIFENMVKQQENKGTLKQDENLWTRVFLSHKRSTGQGLVGRLYEGLKDWYKVFLDSEAKFNIHDLKLIVQNTEVFVFVLTHGILLSHWCLEELKSAVANKKKVGEDPMDDNLEWREPEIEQLLRFTKEHLVWIAEYNSACINALKKRIGVPDQARQVITNNEPLLRQVEQGIIDTTKVQFSLDVQVVQQLSEYYLPTIVKFTGNPAVTDAVLHALSQGGSSIQELDLCNCNKITDAGLRFLSERCHNIQLISLSWCLNITDDGITFLASGSSKIHAIDISCCNKITAKGLQRLADSCVGIRFVNLDACYNISDLGVKYLAERCHDIEVINLSKTGVGDLSLQFLAEGCHNIQSIKLLENYGVTNEGVKCLAEGCPNIQSIQLPDLIHDNAVKFLAESCRNLQSIDIPHCNWITDAGLKFLAQKSPNLISIILPDCRKISDIGLKNLAEGCHNIQLINLKGCQLLTDQGVQYLAEGCHNIQSINLSQCIEISDQSLNWLAQGCRNMNAIDISYCPITDNGVKALIEQGHNLQSIKIEGCKQITEEMEKFLNTRFPS